MENIAVGAAKALSTVPEIRTLPITLDFPEGKIDAEIDLPLGPERLVVLAFKMLAISSEVADMAARAAEKLGLKISCKKVCGACCRQLVPLSPPEAAMIFEFVESMPEPQNPRVEDRASFPPGVSGNHPPQTHSVTASGR